LREEGNDSQREVTDVPADVRPLMEIDSSDRRERGCQAAMDVGIGSNHFAALIFYATLKADSDSQEVRAYQRSCWP
jgi:hypothetical protein